MRIDPKHTHCKKGHQETPNPNRVKKSKSHRWRRRARAARTSWSRNAGKTPRRRRGKDSQKGLKADQAERRGRKLCEDQFEERIQTCLICCTEFQGSADKKAQLELSGLCSGSGSWGAASCLWRTGKTRFWEFEQGEQGSYIQSWI